MTARIDASGDLEVEGRAPLDPSAVLQGLAASLADLRVASSRERVMQLGRDQGYRIEDVVRVAVRGLRAAQVDIARAWLLRRLPPRAEVAFEGNDVVAADAREVVLRAHIRARSPESARTYCVGADGRVGVESVELHVVEHCNLRCAQCCNVSPYLAPRVMPPSEVRAVCMRLREVLRPDVLKVMGGEPLLHPDLGGVLRAIRESGISERMRVFTNGLLLRSVDASTFALFDELTVSSYASAPIPPAVVEETEARAREHDVVLNVKSVPTFSTVLEGRPNDARAMRAVYDECWLRHRCLVVRGGVFYKCTRAAYHADFHRRVDVASRDEDAEATQRSLGIPLDAPDFARQVADYLSSPSPLASCRHCRGSSGPLAPHVQLRKRDVAEGRLERSAGAVSPGAPSCG